MRRVGCANPRVSHRQRRDRCNRGHSGSRLACPDARHGSDPPNHGAFLASRMHNYICSPYPAQRKPACRFALALPMPVSRAEFGPITKTLSIGGGVGEPGCPCRPPGLVESKQRVVIDGFRGQPHRIQSPAARRRRGAVLRRPRQQGGCARQFGEELPYVRYRTVLMAAFA